MLQADPFLPPQPCEDDLWGFALQFTKWAMLAMMVLHVKWHKPASPTAFRSPLHNAPTFATCGAHARSKGYRVKQWPSCGAPNMHARLADGISCMFAAPSILLTVYSTADAPASTPVISSSLPGRVWDSGSCLLEFALEAMELPASETLALVGGMI
jgi:hypothetical protein